MDSFLYVTCMNESFNKHIQPKTEEMLKEIEADDLQLKGKSFSHRFLHRKNLELKNELEQRYAALEQLSQSGNEYDQNEIDKELEALEKLQMKFNKIEAKRKKLAKQNFEQVETKTM